MAKERIEWKKLIAAIFICQLAGVIGSIFTIPNISTWYNALAKPDFAPPGSVIGSVWIALYTLMGVSLYLVWQKDLKKRRTKEAVTAFGLQLLLNAAWPFLFFGLRSPLYGMVGIVALWIAVVATVIRVRRVSEAAAYLLVPYIAWVTFAGFLNFLIWSMN